jgi:hypothetical protein
MSEVSGSWPPRPAELARWPIPWRERWGRLAVELEEVLGLPWQEAEAEAYAQVRGELVASGEPLLEPEPERPDPTLDFFDRPPLPSSLAMGPQRWRCLNRFCLHKTGWWLSVHGVLNCLNCVPPAFPHLVVARGTEADAPEVNPRYPQTPIRKGGLK